MENNKLSARQIGRNVIIMIDGIKYSRVTKNNNEVSTIRTKIELYNKKNSVTRLTEIKNFFKSNEDKEKETKMIVAKGLKKAIKKETKKTTKKSTKKVNTISEDLEGKLNLMLKENENLKKEIEELKAKNTKIEEEVKTNKEQENKESKSTSNREF